MSDPRERRSSGRGGESPDTVDGRENANDVEAPESNVSDRRQHDTTDRRGDIGDSTSNGPPVRGDSTGGGSPLWPYLLDVASSVFIVAAIGGLLFAASGVWPPLVAIESGSMDPHVQKGDLVFVMDEERFPGAGAHDSGVVSARAGQESGYRMFQGYGDVIVYQPDGSETRTPIIHRAMFWVEEGEDWSDRADPEALGERTDCEALSNCPAPHAGFITKGDNNEHYDQSVTRISGPVKPAWIMGTAEGRIPVLGEVRLFTGQASERSPVEGMNATGTGTRVPLTAHP